MDTSCYVCHEPVAPGRDGQMQCEGIYRLGKPEAWVWGPVVVHDECRLDVKTPFDEKVGLDYMAAWERVAPSEIESA